ncbi:MAG: phosphatase PAP2 family protein [Candidatus Aminicenantes bacterium]|nr:MAG: phosphatase PAP2 family protein [Candidatus Aminicenantes bacterium]
MKNHLKKAGVLLLLGFLFLSPHQNLLFADDQSNANRLNKLFLKNFKNDFVGVITSPAGWKKKDFINLSAILGAGLILYVFDQEIQEWAQDNRTSSSDDFFGFITHAGDGGVIAAMLAALYASGEISRNDSLSKTALLSLESWLTTAVIVSSMKFAFGRARPYTGESSHSFHPFSTTSSYFSFPSGHSSAAFAVFTTIAEQSKSVYVDVLAYSVATLCALSRVHNNKHWASDIFIGAVIGHLVAKKICAFDRARNSKKVSLGFHYTRHTKAITVNISF